MASSRSKMIWEISSPLSEYIVGQASRRINATPLADIGIGWRLLGMLNQAVEAFSAPGNVIEQTRKQIRRGNLIATGWRIAPTRSNSPTLIPCASFASGRINLMQNSIHGPGSRYREVRLIDKSALAPSFWLPRPNQSARQAQIRNIISQLEKCGRLNGLRKQQIGIVQSALKQAGIVSGVDKTIERQIRIALNLEKQK